MSWYQVKKNGMKQKLIHEIKVMETAHFDYIYGKHKLSQLIIIEKLKGNRK